MSLLFHCSMSLLCYFKSVDGYLTDPTGLFSVNVPPPVILQTNFKVLSVKNGMPAPRHELGDRTVVEQLSSEHRLASMRVRTGILQLQGRSLDDDQLSAAFFL